MHGYNACTALLLFSLTLGNSIHPGKTYSRSWADLRASAHWAVSLLDLSLDKEKYDMGISSKGHMPAGILRIFLVDDHDVVLEGLQGIICAEADMTVAGTAMN